MCDARAVVVERLEQRVVLSADAAGALADEVLDVTFGAAGRAVVDVVASDGLQDVAALPSGGVLVLGRHAGAGPTDPVRTGVTRLNADGSVDASFGEGGTAFLPSGVGRALRVAADRRVYVAGSVRGASSFQGSDDLLLARLLPTGQLDPSFGTSGVATRDVAGREDVGVDVFERPDGGVLVVGYEQRAFMARVRQSAHIVAARFTAAGQPDPAFGSGGVAVSDLPAFGNERVAAAAVQPDGKVVVAGGVQRQDLEGAPSKVYVARLGADGALDRAFGRRGVVVTRHAGSAADVAVRASGRIVLAGTRTSSRTAADFALWQFRANGARDAAFGGPGGARAGFDDLADEDAGPSADHARQVVELAGGRLAVAGAATGAGLAVARFRPDGRIGATFGDAGRVLFHDVGTDKVAATLAADGKLIAAGGGADVTVFRFAGVTM